jgi:5-methylcytosine-specific restriction endonuclease McrA
MKTPIKDIKEWKDKDTDRYGQNHQMIARMTHQATNSHCCLCYEANGDNQAHHAFYRDDFGKVRDRELPGVHIFSLCPKCHLLAHDRLEGIKSDNWLFDDNDKSYSKNSDVFYARLRYGFLELRQRIKERKNVK